MFIQIKDSKYYLAALYKVNKDDFNAEIEHADGKHFTLNFSKITGRFYKNEKKAKLPKYLCKEVLNLAINAGICILSEEEKENALYWL